jgi:CRISPR-associated protein Cas2
MSGFFAVCFDVCDARRLRRVSDEMENFGTRVQRSLFECHLDDGDIEELTNRISGLINEKEDHVRYYPLCPKDVPGVIIDGPGEKTIDSDFYVV